MNQRYDVLGFGFIVLAVALFSLTGTSDSLFGWLDKWQSLTGSLLGAVGTIVAGLFALTAVQRQIAHSEEKLRQSQEAAKLAAVLALSQPVHAAAITLRHLRAAIDPKSYHRLLISLGAKDVDKPVERCIDQLATSLEHFSLKELARDLDPHRRALYLTIVLELSTFVNIATKRPIPAESFAREHLFGLHIQTLEGAHHYIAAFNADLGRKFAEDGEMAIADRETDAAAA